MALLWCGPQVKTRVGADNVEEDTSEDLQRYVGESPSDEKQSFAAGRMEIPWWGKIQGHHCPEILPWPQNVVFTEENVGLKAALLLQQVPTLEESGWNLPRNASDT